VVALLNWTCIFKWYMTMFRCPEWTLKRHVFNEIGLCAQNEVTIIGSIANITTGKLM
jgi:hypothetical protein